MELKEELTAIKPKYLTHEPKLGENYNDDGEARSTTDPRVPKRLNNYIMICDIP